ncbi:ABC transporter substrate-binding protein [Streptosporangium roseum]|uniref:ABC transporter periplasmic substrate-binding protein n=1 Tax=Streptosporangium roseum (strain ATCC 12428 / DSM 43021 / JCM 3005 / KCTC 9067 / NCIMB 10171 / NRRL 2505 / NI 9100) TaxID=479432 RepID=D2BFF3_STRRD|nr:ABC transporter substrate-binding protein [Streptosporangium roseum]ACZ88311.1 ABC transporter periplasmic substrate-binding protein [Streptosporangium roseum DSM 43021]
MRRTRKIIPAALLALAVAACAPSTGADAPSGTTAAKPLPGPSVDAAFDLDTLVAAAKKEGSLLVYDSSGDIEEVAKAFTDKYGIAMEGVKSDTPQTAEKMLREHAADNVTIDAAMYEDGGVLVGQLIPQGVAQTWVPADLKDQIPQENHNPLLALSKATVFAYNTKLSPDGCPVKNVWDLTEPEWAGKLVMQDPLGKPTVLSFFTQLDAHGNQALEQAYQAKYGKALETKEKSAAYEWIKRMSVNKPVLTGSDEDISGAVGAPSATDKKIGFMSISKFRNNEDKGYAQATCSAMTPFVGFSYPKYVAIAAKSKHPNAAKLYVHFIMTEEGVKHEIGEGGVSGNSTVKPLVTPPGLDDWKSQLFHTDPKVLLGDLQNRQTVSDFWRVNHG